MLTLSASEQPSCTAMSLFSSDLEEFLEHSCPLLSDMAKTGLASYTAKLTQIYKSNGGAAGNRSVGSVTVAAIFDRSLENEDNSSDAGSEYVLPSHLTYSCFLSAPSIASTLVKNTLIDTGALPAMISLTLINKLGLLVQTL